MPFYRFLDTNTDIEQELFLTISERDRFLIDNPHMKQMISGFPMSGVTGDIVNKTPDGFKDILKNIKKKHRGTNIHV